MFEAFSWVVHPLAGFGLALFASVLYGPRGRDYRAMLVPVLLLGLLSFTDAAWVVHPAAGMLLGYFGARLFRPHPPYPALLVALLSGVLFMARGADWLIFPLIVMGMIWLFSGGVQMLFRALDGSAEREALQASAQGRAALPEQAGGLPFLSAPQGEAVPVGARPAQQPAQQMAQPTAAPDPFSSLNRDDRLPGDVRAQLVALDLQTTEALSHLRAQGQEGSEAGYLARAIRDEYAPASVRAYLNLPRTRADQVALQDGKTAHDLLREQLELLLSATQDILDGTVRSGGQELLTQQRFLEDRLGRRRNTDLEL